MTRWAVLISVIIVLSLLAICTMHRDACIKANEIGCTMLPWSGHAPGDNSGVLPKWEVK
jgi:hypothetical protein